MSVTTEPGRRTRRRRIGWIVLASALAIFLAGIGFVIWTFASTTSQIESIENAFPDEADRPELPAQSDDGQDPALNILILGSDSRADASESLLTDLGSRADTIMVAHIPADRDSVQIMSVMRDSWVEIPGHGEAKANAALAHGGVPLMVQTVEGLLDQRIDHVAMLDFNSFQNVTEALEGVTIDNPNDFTSENIHFAQGEITLEGEDALTYVRERMSFPDGDYTRVENQQRFLHSTMSEIMSGETTRNPAKMLGLLESVTPYLALDSELDFGTMLDLGTSMSSVSGNDITTFTMPTTGTGRIGDESVVLVDWDELEEVREHFANSELDGYQPAAR